MILTKFKIRLFTCTSAFLLLFQPAGYSQGTDLRAGGQQKHFYMGFSGDFGKGDLAFTGVSDISKAKSEGKTCYSASFDIGYSFSRVIGLSTGVKYAMYSSAISLASYSTAYDTVDSESEQYNRRITGKNIYETQKLSFVKIPLALNLQIPFSSGFGFYIQAGVNFCIPMQKSFNSSGVFTYSGYYSAYNVTVEGVTYEGFQSDYSNRVNGTLNLKSMYQELFASAGFQINIHNSVSILIGGSYNKMMSNITDNPSKASYRLSTTPTKMKSLLQGSTSASLNSMGLKLSLRFYL